MADLRLSRGWRRHRGRGRLSHGHQLRGTNGDQTSNKKPGYAITQTGRVSAAAPRRCQGAAADGAGRGLRRMAV